MKTTLHLSLCLIFVLLLSCSSSNQINRHVFAIFEGNWQQENSTNIEQWQMHDTFLSGEVIKIQNQDTLTVEYLRIFSENNAIYYEATVPSQNEGKAIRFILTQQNKLNFTFENPNHDFPQKIVYNFKNKNTLNAIISGANKQIEFTYKKQNSIN